MLMAVIGLACFGLFAALPATALAQDRSVLVARLDGPVTPVTAKYLVDGLAEAERSGHQAYLVEIDTPGGLDTSMRDIVKAFLGADVPVVVHVTPAGGRAASAGALITLSAHVAVMAPGTTIGAATPVNMETGEPAGDKVINDAAAFAESVAAQRNRNTAVAAEMVRSGTAITASDAVDREVADLVVADRATMLRDLDGRTVTVEGQSVTLRTADVSVVEYDLGFFRSLLQLIADPNIAFLLLSIGTLAVIYELASPGMGFAGIAGGIMLILAFFALSVLPVAVAGVLLLLLAAALFIGEVVTPGVGVFAAGGTVALLLAGIFLFEGPVAVAMPVLWPTALVVGAGTLLAGRLAWRARRATPVTGRHSLIGRTAMVRDGEQVLLEGALWSVRSPHGPLGDGQTVRVTDLAGLTLIAEPVEPADELGDARPSASVEPATDQPTPHRREGES